MHGSIDVTRHIGECSTLPADPALTLAQALFLAGVWAGVSLCAGLGKCGACRVRYQAAPPDPVADETRLLTPAELAAGWRLACRHPAAGGIAIELAEAPRPRTRQPQAAAAGRMVAVDLGTTSLCWSVIDAEGRRLAEGSEPNPQLGAGSEIMSRLAFAAEAGRGEHLRRLVLDRLSELSEGASSLAVAGNSAMIYILLGLPLQGLAAAPYRLGYRAGEWRELGPGLPPTYIPPLLAPFVGADLSAGLASVVLGRGGEEPTYPFLLADLGTNGEFVLAVGPGEYLVTSVPMGPALEGVGLRFGATARPGAASGFEVTPAGLTPRVIGGGAAERISGTGYISLMAALKRVGLLGPEGGFRSAGAGTTPLAARLAARLGQDHGEPVFRLSDSLFLPASDVEETLKVKAAFNLAVSMLLRESGLAPAEISSYRLAGALGQHVSAADLEELGFLPPGARARVVTAGNTSLAGAELALVSSRAREWMENLPDGVRVVEPAADAVFLKEFTSRMVFAYVA